MTLGKIFAGDGVSQSLGLILGMETHKVTIQNKLVKVSSKIVGLMVPVNNNWTDEFKRMKLKSDCHAILTMVSPT